MKTVSGIVVYGLAAIACCQMAGCANVRLQSMDQAANEISKSVQRNARQECQRNNTNMSDYLLCVERVDRTYDKFRQERQKQKT